MLSEKTGKSVQLIKGKENVAQMIYTIAIVIEMVVMMTDHFASWTLPSRGRFTHVAFALFCAKILMTEYDRRQVLFITSAAILGTISYLTCGDEYVIRAVALVAASIGADIEKNLRIIFWGTLVGTIIIVVLSLLGICGNVADIRDYGRGMVEARYCLGFNHANNVHDVFWYLICLYMLLRRDKMSWIDFGLMTIANAGLYVLTRSRTGVIAAQLIIFGAFLIKYVLFVRDGITMQIICILSLAFTVAVTIYGSIYNVHERELVAKMDRILTGRLEMLTEHANFKDWKVFPSGRSAEFVDNGFSTITYCYGTIIGALVVILLIIAIIALIRNRESLLSLLLTSAILVMFMEATFIINISLLCNMLLIIMILCLCDRKKVLQEISIDKTQ